MVWLPVQQSGLLSAPRRKRKWRRQRSVVALGCERGGGVKAGRRTGVAAEAGAARAVAADELALPVLRALELVRAYVCMRVGYSERRFRHGRRDAKGDVQFALRSAAQLAT